MSFLSHGITVRALFRAVHSRRGKVMSAYKPPRSIVTANSGQMNPKGQLHKVQQKMGWTFSACALIIIGLFVFIPAIDALYLSFTNVSGFNKPSFVGLENYQKIFTDPDIGAAFGHTALYTLFYVPLILVASLGVALLLNRKDLPFRSFFRSAIFLPFVISMAVASITWKFLFDPNLGFLPYWLSKLEIHMGDVLSNPGSAMAVVIFVGVWKNFGYFMVIFLAGLQSVSSELYEAAELDGAGPWRKFTAVTLPGLQSTTTYVIIMVLIQALQVFDQIYVMTAGGPDHSTETVVYRIYTEGFKDFNQGLSSAISYLLLLVTLVIGLVQLWFNAKHEREELQ